MPTDPTATAGSTERGSAPATAAITAIEQIPYAEILAGDGALIGWRTIREKDEPICDNTCDTPLAPGSSPHSHPQIVTYVLYAERGYAEVDAATGLVMAAGVLHPFPARSTP